MADVIDAAKKWSAMRDANEKCLASDGQLHHAANTLARAVDALRELEANP